MKKHDLQNERLDQIGRNLLKATRVSREEIEKIVIAPQLLDSIKTRIKAEEQSRRKPNGFFGYLASLSFWNRQTAAGAFAILIILVICSAVIIFKTRDSPQLTEQTIEPEIPVQITQAEKPLPSETNETKIPAVENLVSIKRIAFKPETSKLPNRVRKPNPVKGTQGAKKQSQEVFYSLAFGGNWEADGEDLQIVRAEISRSELFALGVNLSIENESEKLKTDLLVGSDGRPRAIRFVK